VAGGVEEGPRVCYYLKEVDTGPRPSGGREERWGGRGENASLIGSDGDWLFVGVQLFERREIR